MRFDVSTEGTPGYICAEVAVRELVGAEEAHAWADDWWTPLPHHRLISEVEARMRPAYRAALERWERRDDAVMQRTEVAEILEGRRGTAEREAAEGCRVAAAALGADDDELIRDAVCRHGHTVAAGARRVSRARARSRSFLRPSFARREGRAARWWVSLNGIATHSIGPLGSV